MEIKSLQQNNQIKNLKIKLVLNIPNVRQIRLVSTHWNYKSYLIYFSTLKIKNNIKKTIFKLKSCYLTDPDIKMLANYISKYPQMETLILNIDNEE